MSKSFRDIRALSPDKFLLLENYEEREISDTAVEVTGAESFQAYNSLREVFTAYRKLKSEGRNVVFCTPLYQDSFILERQPSARILA